jgi:hypothetical protein
MQKLLEWKIWFWSAVGFNLEKHKKQWTQQ